MLRKLLALIFLSVFFASTVSAMALTGAGASFPYLIYLKWNRLFFKKTGVRINYQSIGSGGGIRQFSAGIVDFGGSDAPMSDKLINKAGGDILHIPTVMGAVALSYNLPQIKRLRLDAKTLAQIYLGRIKKWNDDAIAALNPKVVLPDIDIIVAHRSDGSGTTSIFTTYLAKVSPVWSSKVGKGKAVAWPTGVGGKGNEGVSGMLKVNRGAIGYISLAYAITNKLPVVALQNKYGKFVAPTLKSTSQAANGALKSKQLLKRVKAGDYRLDLTNAPGKNSYPIVGMTWLLVHKNQKNNAKGQALKRYLKWILSAGQQYAADLLYAPLPQNLRNKVKVTVAEIKI